MNTSKNSMSCISSQTITNCEDCALRWTFNIHYYCPYGFFLIYWNERLNSSHSFDKVAWTLCMLCDVIGTQLLNISVCIQTYVNDGKKRCAMYVQQKDLTSQQKTVDERFKIDVWRKSRRERNVRIHTQTHIERYAHTHTHFRNINTEISMNGFTSVVYIAPSSEVNLAPENFCRLHHSVLSRFSYIGLCCIPFLRTQRVFAKIRSIFLFQHWFVTIVFFLSVYLGIFIRLLNEDLCEFSR